MINQKEITVDWLNQVSRQHGNADKILVEKLICAISIKYVRNHSNIKNARHIPTILQYHF